MTSICPKVQEQSAPCQAIYRMAAEEIEIDVYVKIN